MITTNNCFQSQSIVHGEHAPITLHTIQRMHNYMHTHACDGSFVNMLMLYAGALFD